MRNVDIREIVEFVIAWSELHNGFCFLPYYQHITYYGSHGISGERNFL